MQIDAAKPLMGSYILWRATIIQGDTFDAADWRALLHIASLPSVVSDSSSSPLFVEELVTVVKEIHEGVVLYAQAPIHEMTGWH